MKILAFLHDAYGGLGGIAQNNRDMLEALVADLRVEQVVALPRILGSGQEPFDGKIVLLG